MMRYLTAGIALLLAVTLATAAVAQRSTSSSLQITISPPQTTAMVYPIITGFSPDIVLVPIPAPAGTVVTTASVQNSDGSAFTGTVQATGDPLFTTHGLSVVLARATTAADQNMPHKVMVTATEPGPNGAFVSWALQPDAGSIPCDIGPPANQIPQNAQAAGFTHCAMNLDFSQPHYANLSNWDNSNYFSAKGTDPSLLFYSGSGGVKFFPPQTITQKYDQAAGVNVVNFHWDPVANGNMGSAWSGGVGQANQVGVATWNQMPNNWSGAATWDIGNSYWDTTARMEGGPCLPCGWNTAGPSDVYTGGPTGEVDIFEFDTDTANGVNPGGQATGHAVNGGWANWAPGNTALPVNYSMFDYHTYSTLQTSDGVTDAHACLYVDYVLTGPAGCSTVTAAQGANFSARGQVLISAGSNKGTAVQPIDMDVQNVRVWSCPSYKTSMCNGTALVSQTLPTGQALSYYH